MVRKPPIRTIPPQRHPPSLIFLADAQAHQLIDVNNIIDVSDSPCGDGRLTHLEMVLTHLDHLEIT